ncbi:MAG: hypothetical protein H6661_02515 [Ardenticatenaceae bacterium]|nr:hypothetical protein [Ardenticatenaceae bacterium]
MAAGDLDRAVFLYEEAINNPNLETAAFLDTEAATKAAIDQFAAFRLILIDLQKRRPDPSYQPPELAEQRLSGHGCLWGNPIGQQLVRLTNAAQLCEAIETNLATFENPTGALADMGYGNPSLTAVDFCP